MRLPVFACAIALLTPCCISADPDPRLSFDATRTGVAGTTGPFGVLHTLWHAQSRVTEAIVIEATYAVPIDETPLPTVVFIHRGDVPPARYQWLQDHIASRGYTVIAPRHFATVPILEADNAQIALDSATELGFVTPGTKIAIAGHALGGTVAALNFAADDRFAGLALLAATPAPGNLRQRDRPVLAIAGTQDEKVTPDLSRTELERFTAPRWFGLVDGMNHYAWTDENTERDLAGDGNPLGDIGRLRRDATRLLDLWLDGVLRDDAAALAELALITDAEASAP